MKTRDHAAMAVRVAGSVGETLKATVVIDAAVLPASKTKVS